MKIYPCTDKKLEVAKPAATYTYKAALNASGIYKINNNYFNGRLVVFGPNQAFWINADRNDIGSPCGFGPNHIYIKTDEKLCLEVQ